AVEALFSPAKSSICSPPAARSCLPVIGCRVVTCSAPLLDAPLPANLQRANLRVSDLASPEGVFSLAAAPAQGTLPNSGMGRVFAFVRPEARALRERICAFLESSGYRLGPGLTLEARTPNEEAAAWVDLLDVDLLVLPYHLHRDV